MTTTRFAREISPGLTVAVDDSLSVVLLSSRPVHTVTNVEAFRAALEDARAWVTVMTPEPLWPAPPDDHHQVSPVQAPDGSWYCQDCDGLVNWLPGLPPRHALGAPS